MTDNARSELTGSPDEIGRKVICIDARGGGPNDPTIIEGKTYTVKGFDDETDGLGVWLVDVPNTSLPEWSAPLSWRATRFRLVPDNSVSDPT